MRKLWIVALLMVASAPAWATCSVANIFVSFAGSYSNLSGVTVTITGPGVGGATASPNFVFVGSYGGYYYLSSVSVTNAGSYTGPVTVTISGGTTGPPTNSPATAYASMTGSCSAGGSRRRFAWLL